MKAALKLIMTVTGLLLIGVNLVVVLLLTRFEGVLRDGLTYQAGQILNADVHLEAVRVDWAEQALVFRGVSVFNPEGFSDREALRIESLLVRPELTSVFAKTPSLREVVLEQPSVHVQYGDGGGTNLGALTDHARQWTTSQEEGEKRIWGRSMTVDKLRAGPARVEVKRIGAPDAGPEIPMAGFSVESPAGDTAISGARVMQVVLECMMRRMSGEETLPPPAREALLGEVDLESA